MSQIEFQGCKVIADAAGKRLFVNDGRGWVRFVLNGGVWRDQRGKRAHTVVQGLLDRAFRAATSKEVAR